MRAMCRAKLIAVLVLIPAAIAFAQKPTSHKAGILETQVPAANPDKYRAVRDARDWENPYLVVQVNGIEVLTTGAAARGPTVPVADVIGYLERLPKRDWPYGRVVAVMENGVGGAKQDGVRIEQNWSELLRRLKEAGVRAELWPSA